MKTENTWALFKRPFTKTGKTAKLNKPIKAKMLRWGSHETPDCTMPPGEYVRIGVRQWAVWLGQAPSAKYIYQVPK